MTQGVTLHNFERLRRRVRLVLLIDAAEHAGLAPIAILPLHTLAYLSNVLAPVWDMPPLEGKILKRRGGPFYPVLQGELDSLVGQGVALISSVGYARDEDSRWRLEGRYRLNYVFAQKILDQVAISLPEKRLASFLQELALAMSALPDEDLTSAMTEDATYADALTDVGGVVDFAEWQQRNYSANAADTFTNVMPHGGSATPGEKLHFYVRHLRTRMQRVAVAS